MIKQERSPEVFSAVASNSQPRGNYCTVLPTDTLVKKKGKRGVYDIQITFT